ncbi:MAG: ABC transporter ATP-binding protein [Bacteroidota bacterium]
MLHLTNYSKSYLNQTVLSIDNLAIREGLHLIQGANGSGKTTLFQSISGIINFHGECILNGINLNKQPVEYRRLINYCEAEPQFPGFLTGKELLRFVHNTKQTPKSDFDGIVELFGLQKFWNQPIATYSSGMLKKTSLATAFAGIPKAILLDEPFTTIDLAGKNFLCDMIKEYQSRGCLFLISAHQQTDTIPLSFDSILVLENNTLKR